jgi:hypothetical protein
VDAGLLEQPTLQVAADAAADPGVAGPGAHFELAGLAGIEVCRRLVLQPLKFGADADLQILEPFLGAGAPGVDLGRNVGHRVPQL